MTPPDSGIPGRPDPSAIVEPAHHWMPPGGAVTFGPEVAEVCERAGYVPDPEQRLILDDVFSFRLQAGRLIPTVFEYGLQGQRQQMKSGALIQMGIGWLFVLPRAIAPTESVWTAHVKSTANKVFGELIEIIRGAPFLQDLMPLDRYRGINQGKDTSRIYTADGRSIDVFARTESGGRGLTGDRIILDESLYLTPGMMGSLLATLTARPAAQAVHAGTAGEVTSQVWRRKRDEGRAGGSSGLGWVDWGIPWRPCKSPTCRHYPPISPAWAPGCLYDDESLWGQALPLLGRRRANGTGLGLQRLRTLRNSLEPAEWARDYLGLWDDPADEDADGGNNPILPLFDPSTWPSLLADDPPFPRTPDGTLARADFPLEAIGVGVAADLSVAALCGAGRREQSDGSHKLAVRLIAQRPGYSWVGRVLPQIRAAVGADRLPPLIIDGRGPAAQLVEILRRDKVRHIATNVQQFVSAHASFYTRARTRQIEHGGQSILSASVEAMAGRRMTDRVVIDRSAFPSAAAEAAILALWGCDTGKRPVSRGGLTRL